MAINWDVVLADVESGMSCADAARKHGLKPDTVQKRVSRQRKSNQTGQDRKDRKDRKDRTRRTKGQGKKTPMPSVVEIDRVIADAVEDNEELTLKERDFCRYYIRNFNATQAYLKAYNCTYETANSKGPEKLVKDSIKDEIRRLRSIKNEMIGIGEGDDVVELHMRIAFADMNDFVEFENKPIPIARNGEAVIMSCPTTGEEVPLHRNKNEVRLKDSNMVDGQLITAVTEGREGVSIKLADRQKSLAFLERYFELNPMDRHRKDYDENVIALRERETSIKEAESTYVAMVKEMQDKMSKLDAKLDNLTLEELRKLANGNE